MVAFVSGSSLGLSNSSLALVGSNGIVGDPRNGRAGEQVYINVATGDLVVQRQDELVESMDYGLASSLVRTYNSQGQFGDTYKDDWSMSVIKTLSAYAPGASITRTDGDGAALVYTWDSTKSAYVNKDGAGAYDKLTLSGSTWTWVDGDTGAKETYDATTLKIQTASDREGQTTTYAYGSGGRLDSITDAAGERATFSYGTGATANLVMSIRTTNADATTSTRIYYGYDTSDAAHIKLTSATVDLSPNDNVTTDNQVYTSTYAYGTNGLLSSITQTDGSSLTFGYDASQRVTTITQTLASGTVTRVTSVDYANRTVTDPLGNITTFTYDANKRLTGIVHPGAVGSQPSVSFEYGAASNKLEKQTDGRGNVIRYVYDQAGHQTEQRSGSTATDGTGNTIRRTFSATSGVLLSETAFLTPDPDGDGAGQPTNGLTTTYVYNATETHVHFVVSSQGRVTEYLYDKLGNQLSATDALGTATYTYYDSLGRTTAVATMPAKQKDEQIAQVTIALLNRAPTTGTTGELNTYKGMSFFDIAKLVWNSQPTLASQSNSAYVTQLYNNLVGRAPDSGGLAGWTNRLATLSGTMAADAAHAQLLQELVAGFENGANSDSAAMNFEVNAALAGTSISSAASMAKKRVAIAQLYVAVLGRAPDPAGLDYYANGASQPDATMAQNFFNSPEGQLIYPPGTTTEELATRLYEGMYGHAPDPATLADWINTLPDQANWSTQLGSFIVAKINALVTGAASADLLGFNNKVAAGLPEAVDANASPGMLTELQLDVFGNTVARTDYANGPLYAIEGSYGKAASSTDRHTYTMFDAAGHAIESVDANGKIAYSAYDKFGRDVKDWRTVTAPSGATTTVSQQRVFDAVGRLAEVDEADGNAHKTYYNQFGEVTSRSIKVGTVETTYENNYYDVAGRMYRSNAGDGVDRIFLFDAFGNKTAQASSATTSFAGVADGGQILSTPSGLVETMYKYDLLGNIVSQINPKQYASDIGTVSGTSVATIPTSTMQVATVGAAITATAQPTQMQSGQDTYWIWGGNNSVSVSYTSLAGLGGGDVRIQLTCTIDTDVDTNNVVPQSMVIDQDYQADQAVAGATVTWEGTQSSAIAPGAVTSVDRVQVYKKDVNGNWQLVLDRDTLGDYGSFMKVDAPVDPDIKRNLWYRTGTNAYVQMALKGQFGDQFLYDLSALGAATYDYKVTAGLLTDTVIDNGTFTISTTPASSTLSSAVTPTPVAAQQATITRKYDRWGNMTEQSDAANSTALTKYFYDGVGRMLSYYLHVTSGTAYANRYNYGYREDDDSQVKSITAYRDSGGGNFTQMASTVNSFDANGHLISSSEAGSDNTTDDRYLSNDFAGRVLRKVESTAKTQPFGQGTLVTPTGTHTTYTLIANGEAIGSAGDSGSADASTFAQDYTPMSDKSLESGPTSYVVMSGDTLQSIAKAVWGDADLWFLIAQANGFTSISPGQSIVIPPKSDAEFNSYQTFKPYDPNAAVGDTTPYLAPPTPKHHHGILGDILAIVIAIVAIVLVQPYLLTLLSPTAGGVAAAAAAGETAAGAATIGEAAAVGEAAGATAISADGAMALSYAGTAALGSVGGQLAQIAVGNQNSIRWGQVALSALSAGFSQGLPSVLPSVLGTGTAQVIAKAALANALTQGIGVATGLQKSFDWRSVAAAGVGAGVTSIATDAMAQSLANTNWSALTQRIVSRGAGAFAGGLTAAAMHGGKVAVVQVAVDAFGNALGQGLVEQSQPSGPTLTAAGDFARADRASYSDYVNTQQWIAQSDAIQSQRLDENYARQQTELADLGGRTIEDMPVAGYGEYVKAMTPRAPRPTVQLASSKGVSEWDNNNTPLPSFATKPTSGVAASSNSLWNRLGSVDLSNIPGVGWLSQEQATSSAQYWQQRLDATGNPAYAALEGWANLWADHAQEVGILAMSLRGGVKLTGVQGELAPILRYQAEGAARQALVEEELAAQYPNATVQSERYLRLENGQRAIDPMTGTARRIDSVVVERGTVLDSVETTSLNAEKDAQMLKEMRIRNNGGTYVRDLTTGQLVDISQVQTRIVRKP